MNPRSPLRRRAAALGLVSLVLPLAGCTIFGVGDQRAERPERPESDQRQRVDLTDAFPSHATTGRYRVTAGPRAGDEVALRLTPAAAVAEDLEPHVAVVAGDKDDADEAGEQAAGRAVMEIEGLRRLWLERTADGSIRAPFIDDLIEQVRVSYDPALPVVPAQMIVGEPIEHEVDMRIDHLADGSRRATGGGTITLELVEVGSFETPMGTVEGYRLREEHDLRLSLARVNVTVESTYGRDLGLVASTTVRRTRALGLFGGDERETIERIE